MSILAYTRAAIIDLPKNLSLAWILAIRDFRSRYVGSIGGYLWALLSPALYCIAFVLVRQALQKEGIEIDTKGAHPIAFAFMGIAIYQLWLEALNNQLNYIKRGLPFLRNMPVAPEIFALSQLILSMMDLGVRLLLIGVVMLVFHAPIGPLAPWAPILFLMAVLTGNALGYILAFPGSFYSDIQKFINAISLAILLGTPIFYPATRNTDSAIYWLQVLNPLAVTIETGRNLLFGDDLNFILPAIVWTLGLLILSTLMMGAYRIITPLIVERI